MSTFIIVIAAFMAPVFIGWLARSGGDGLKVIKLSRKGDLFEISNKLRIFSIPMAIVLVSLFVVPFFMIPNREQSDWIVFGSLAFIFFMIGLMAILEAFRSYVFIDTDGIVYRKVWKVRVIGKHEIKDVSVINFFLCVDLKSGKHVLIPLKYFCDSCRMIYLAKDLIKLSAEENLKDAINSTLPST